MGKTVAIVIITFRNPSRLISLLENMVWAGIPDVPLYVFEDPSPYDDRDEIVSRNIQTCSKYGLKYDVAPRWECMQGITQYALERTREDWIIWIPDDVLFTQGGLWNEYAGILAYGRDWVGGIQAPYWNAKDLVSMGSLKSKELMFEGWLPEDIPQNPHWNDRGLPRAYINLNGAGFSLNRRLWNKVAQLPQRTWRLDEYLGYMSWRLGFVILTLPGQPRVHYMGGSNGYGVKATGFDRAEAFEDAIGKSIADATGEIYVQMHKLEHGGQFHEMLAFFNNGGVL
jgi:hypothetical protein